jgi:hypothetical protein
MDSCHTVQYIGIGDVTLRANAFLDKASVLRFEFSDG